LVWFISFTCWYCFCNIIEYLVMIAPRVDSRTSLGPGWGLSVTLHWGCWVWQCWRSRSESRWWENKPTCWKRREGGEAGAERARSSDSQLLLPSSHQVAVAHWRVVMSFVRVLLSSSSKAAGCACVRPHYARGRRGARFLPWFVFVPPSRPVLVTVILRTFSAPLPKRVVLSAFARRMRLCDLSHSLSLTTCIRQSMYTTFPRPRRSCPQEACAWEIGSCCTPRKFRRLFWGKQF
jgi:hypothetical protein